MKVALNGAEVFYDGSLQKVNILIDGSRIAQISSDALSGDETLDVTGLTILPGLIDVHVHLREPGLEHKETIVSGTSAAAAGGVTTILEMPNTTPATTTLELLEQKKELFKEKSIVNYGIYLGATGKNTEDIKNAQNIAGVKIYMGSSTGDLLVTDEKAIEDVMRTGVRTVLHAEDEELMKDHEKMHQGRKDPIIHADIRNPAVACAAMWKALGIVKNNPTAKVHFTHTSSEEEMKLLREAKKTLTITADTTPHHLFLNEEALQTQGNFAKMNPALRSKKDVAAVWGAIDDGTIDLIATDHAGHAIDEKEADYWSAPSGVPGLETMLPLLLDAVNKGKVNIEKVVALCSSNPARIFGIHNKGEIKEGRDADLVIVDMNQKKRVQNEKLYTQCKWSPFNGWELQGWPVVTYVQGTVVYDGEIHNHNGREVKFR